MMTNPLAPAWLALPADANRLEPELWPSTLARGGDGELVVGGVAVTGLLAEHGSPLYVIDEADARARAIRWITALQGEAARIGTSAKVYYAGKAFLSIEVARWMSELGLNLDVASGGEFAVTQAAGVDPERVGFHGNNKSEQELLEAIAHGVGTIILDSTAEIEQVAAIAARIGRVQPVRLRINTGVHAHTHEFLATAREDQKFGIPLNQVEQAVQLIRAEPSLQLLGLHGHIGSQIFGSDGFAASAARLLEVHARLLEAGPVPELNLGGGFGIAYTAADDPASAEDLARELADIVAAECARLDIPVPVLCFEPGRSIIGPAGITLYTVGTVKDVDVVLPGGSAEATAGRRYLSIDGGMSDNARTALYQADYHVRLANRSSTAEPVLVRVVGKHCESGDIVVNHDYLPGDTGRGDVLAVAATGAYCWSLASNYNYLGRPAVVAVRDGASRVLIRRESIADLLARDTGVSTVPPNGDA